MTRWTNAAYWSFSMTRLWRLGVNEALTSDRVFEDVEGWDGPVAFVGADGLVDFPDVFGGLLLGVAGGFAGGGEVVGELGGRAGHPSRRRVVSKSNDVGGAFPGGHPACRPAGVVEPAAVAASACPCDWAVPWLAANDLPQQPPPPAAPAAGTSGDFLAVRAGSRLRGLYPSAGRGRATNSVPVDAVSLASTGPSVTDKRQGSLGGRSPSRRALGPGARDRAGRTLLVSRNRADL